MKIKRIPIGGAQLPEEKSYTQDLPIITMTPPKKVMIPLHQHVGEPCKPLVEVGDKVRKGACIGRSRERLSAQIHASISGEVVAIEKHPGLKGGRVECIVMKQREEELEELLPGGEKNPPRSPNDMLSAVEEAGIVGMGGGGFPCHIKLETARQRKVDTIIINGAECEPFLTADYRLMVEQPHQVFRGLHLILQITGAKRGIIACKINKPQALQRLIQEKKKWEAGEVVALDTPYPHGAERQLIRSVLNRKVPNNGLPFDVQAMVQNVQTTIAIAEAVDKGHPLTTRILTVSGQALRSPKNLQVPLGTTVQDVIGFCNGPFTNDFQVIVGGPMTGYLVPDLSSPIMKDSLAVLLFPANTIRKETPGVCIRCGKCVAACPQSLIPHRIASYLQGKWLEKASQYQLWECLECGACAYVCPAKRPLLYWFRNGKATLQSAT